MDEDDIIDIMQETEFDKFKHENPTYEEAGSLNVNTSGLGFMKITKESMNGNPLRQDKKVEISTSEDSKRISSMMFGYNKLGIALADGTFMNSSELAKAIEEAVNNLAPSATIFNIKTGNTLNIEDLINVAIEAAGAIIISPGSTKITNQETKRWSVQGSHTNEIHNKGIAFLGNSPMELIDGKYISQEEFLSALKEYTIFVPKQSIKVPEEKNGSNEEEVRTVVRITEKNKNNLSRWLSGLAASLLIAGTLSMPLKHQEQRNVNYSIDNYSTEEQTTFDTDTFYSSDLFIGSSNNNIAENATVGYYYGDLTGRTSVINGKASDLLITGYCLLDVSNNKEYRYLSDIKQSEKPEIENLGDLVTKTLKENPEINFDQLQLTVHLGNIGWVSLDPKVSLSELVDVENKETAITNYIDHLTTYEGEEKQFNGNTITITTVSNEKVQLKVVDDEGNLLSNGSKVTGSDGKQYIVSKLEETTEKVENSSEEDFGKKIDFSIKDIALSLSVASLAGAVASFAYTNKKNKKSQEEPKFYEFESQEDYEYFKKEFQKAKENFDKKSSFSEKLKTVFTNKKYEESRKLTSADKEKLYSAIMTHKAYTNNSSFSFQDGKIIITSEDGVKKDITDSLSNSIKSIGVNNSIDAIGKTEGMENSGIRRR